MIHDKKLVSTSTENISEEDINSILRFLFEIRSNSYKKEEKQYNLLSKLREYFGFKCASLWSVRPDLSMTQPFGLDMDDSLLEDYERYLQVLDDFSMKNLSSSGVNITSIMEYDDNNRTETSSIYQQRLRNSNITQKYGIIICDEGQIKGCIGLFKSADGSDPEALLSPSCLEMVAPFIAQEFLCNQEQEYNDHISSMLSSILNTCDVGIALFNKDRPHNVLYFNPVCVRYCYEFISNHLTDSIISDFLNEFAFPLDQMFPDSNDLSIELESKKGVRYRIKFVDNNNSTSTLYIAPCDAGNRPNTDCQMLFSQLTPREKEIALLVSQGYTNAQIAEKLFVSLPTVKSHLQHIFEKAEVSNRMSLMALMSGE